MPSSDELETILDALMDDLSDRAGTGGQSEDDEPLEGDYHGDD